jgi:hypothetical protein
MLTAEYAIGKWLRNNIPHGGGRPRKTGSRDPVLSDIGTTRVQSKRWRTIARIREERVVSVAISAAPKPSEFEGSKIFLF